LTAGRAKDKLPKLQRMAELILQGETWQRRRMRL
jgi:hypothetical protein